MHPVAVDSFLSGPFSVSFLEILKRSAPCKFHREGALMKLQSLSVSKTNINKMSSSPCFSIINIVVKTLFDTLRNHSCLRGPSCKKLFTTGLEFVIFCS